MFSTGYWNSDPKGIYSSPGSTPFQPYAAPPLADGVRCTSPDCNQCRDEDEVLREMYGGELDDARDDERDDAWLTLVAYLLLKVEECDWHGVSDDANDLRVMEARQDVERASE
jgi:hypothetical protein